MSAIAYDSPRWYPNEAQKTVVRRPGILATGQVWNDADFLLQTATGLAIASNNTLTVTGLADHAVPAGIFAPIGSDVTNPRAPFMNSIVNTPAQPFAPGAAPHYLSAEQNRFEISLKEIYHATMVGVQTVGLTVDTTSGFWLASTAASACALMTAALDGPGLGTEGDTGKRIVIKFTNANG